MKFKPLALAAAVALPSSLAFGADLSQTLVLTPDNGSFSAGLTATHLESAFFVDTFSFELPAMQTGTVTAEFFSTDPNLDLLFGFLEGEGYFFDGLPGAQTASVTVPGLSGLQTVSVSGTAGDAFGPPTSLSASYTGSITFTPDAVGVIPEPETYALMLAGLGLVGFMARRRGKA
ncbi:FxDxF family PEP-CTERM protein [Methylibium sp.]|uniref:FxDxF family PEP-CTERM protein n=1 Tax=Methylibium sp. TaxID=2067992 RepID=UPI0025D0C682|nr:FxDxF family PEP-CTERM protein [Methylibium sp.]